MSTGRVCEKHQEWCPTGECRWCAPVAAKQTPLEPLRFDEWTPGEPLTFDRQPLDSLFWEGGRQPRGAIDIDGAMNRMWVDAMNRMWVKLVEREQPPRLPFDEWLEFYGKKDGG